MSRVLCLDLRIGFWRRWREARATARPWRSGRIEAQAGPTRSLPEETPDITIKELRRRSSNAGIRPATARSGASSSDTRSRAILKTAHTSEHNRPDILKRRRARSCAGAPGLHRRNPAVATGDRVEHDGSQDIVQVIACSPCQSACSRICELLRLISRGSTAKRDMAFRAGASG